MSEYWSGAHTRHRLTYHLVWIPKYRKKVLSGEVLDYVKELFLECAEANEWRIDELNVQPDHVHMLIQLKPDVALSKVIQLFKGTSSRRLRQAFPSLQDIYWGDSFWGDGFFAETVGNVDIETIRKYIQNQ